jgi:predicted RNA-binding Zn ribbon-like protein
MLLADAPALDFLNSVAAPWGEPIEWLASGADLVAWLLAAGLLTPDAAAAASQIPGRVLDETAKSARGLREWFRGFVAAHADRPLGPEALAELAPLNRLLAEDAAHAEIIAGMGPGSGFAVRWTRDWSDPRSLLMVIGQAMADLVRSADFSRIRACEGRGCTLVFHDVSKRNSRRWCSMAVCGNRAKQAAHRARRREA